MAPKATKAAAKAGGKQVPAAEPAAPASTAEAEQKIEPVVFMSTDSFVGEVAYSMLNPGINKSTLIVVYVSMGSLFLSLLFLGFVWEFNFHVLLMLFSTLGLIIAFQWSVFHSFYFSFSALIPCSAPRFVSQLPQSYKEAGKEHRTKQT